MKPSGAHTHPDGGSGIGAAVLVVLAAIVIVKAAGPVMDALAELVRLVVIAAAVIVGLAGAVTAAYVAYRMRRGWRSAPLVVGQVQPVTRRAAQAVQEPQRSAAALPAAQRPELHLHFHGVDAEDVAAILRQQHLDG